MLENMITSSCTFRNVQIESRGKKPKASHSSSLQAGWLLGSLLSRTGDIHFCSWKPDPDLLLENNCDLMKVEETNRCQRGREIKFGLGLETTASLPSQWSLQTSGFTIHFTCRVSPSTSVESNWVLTMVCAQSVLKE